DVFAERAAESAAFHHELLARRCVAPGRGEVPPAIADLARQAYAGLLWSKQFYHYVVPDWIQGDPEQPAPPAGRGGVRNGDWGHLFARDIISMPDKWEYPWFAAWDLAFHMLPMARIDPAFAKAQLNLLLREWYMHPNGQLPAYEYNFSDVNPPVHAWACWRVYKLTGARGARDRGFLARVFQKLVVNFTWWVNRKDPRGNHLFAGGFLGLDNIGVFDRSKPLPTGGHLEQADGTAWMAFYCGTMLAMALELAETDPAYEDIASKFFEHFIMIADAMNSVGGSGLWHEEDGFYYDQLLDQDGRAMPLRLRSMVGIIPLFAVEFIDEKRLDSLPGFAKRTRWFLKHRRDLADKIAYLADSDSCAGRHLLAIPSKERLARVLRYVFDEAEFLSPHGVRSLSKRYEKEPFVFEAGGERHEVRYVPGDADSWLFGGNSNWRGPVWFPVNYLLIEALERYHLFYGDGFKVEVPTGSGVWMTLGEAARELSRRLASLFLPAVDGPRPAMAGATSAWASSAADRELVLFHEFFHGDTGRGLGASHQTGWTALVTELLR
ncbi:MAG: glucosidase, partial [Burkholderiales bacterium]|nr:glucosidase [Opitutaceae bacterium]